MFVIDDIGWNDVGYHQGGKNITATPYLDSLARDGIMLNRYYVQPVCSATRAAFMQGMQDGDDVMRLRFIIFLFFKLVLVCH
jgi:arylsulfatase A-like enzyme